MSSIIPRTIFRSSRASPLAAARTPISRTFASQPPPQDRIANKVDATMNAKDKDGNPIRQAHAGSEPELTKENLWGSGTKQKVPTVQIENLPLLIFVATIFTLGSGSLAWHYMQDDQRGFTNQMATNKDLGKIDIEHAIKDYNKEKAEYEKKH